MKFVLLPAFRGQECPRHNQLAFTSFNFPVFTS